MKCWPPCRKMRTPQALLGLCYTLARRQGEAEAVLAPLAAGEGPRAGWPPGCFVNSGKNRRLV